MINLDKMPDLRQFRVRTWSDQEGEYFTDTIVMGHLCEVTSCGALTIAEYQWEPTIEKLVVYIRRVFAAEIFVEMEDVTISNALTPIVH